MRTLGTLVVATWILYLMNPAWGTNYLPGTEWELPRAMDRDCPIVVRAGDVCTADDGSYIWVGDEWRKLDKLEAERMRGRQRARPLK